MSSGVGCRVRLIGAARRTEPQRHRRQSDAFTKYDGFSFNAGNRAHWESSAGTGLLNLSIDGGSVCRPGLAGRSAEA